LVSYRQLSSGQVVLHERETTSSGRPKALSLQQEDADFYYEYDSRGGLKSKRPKTNLDKYNDWYKTVEWRDSYGRPTNNRSTPLTPFESAIGVRTSIPSYRYHWCLGTRECGAGRPCTYGCQGGTFNEKEWEIFKQTHTIDYGNLEYLFAKDIPAPIGQGHYDWKTYFTDKANKLNLEIVSIANLEFREKQKPAVVEKIPETSRPNPKEVEKVEPVEVEPIEEVVKYSPLMIAGVIAVIVIILWRRA